MEKFAKNKEYKFLGFDMDFTLLKYHPIHKFHKFIFKCFSKSLVEICGWNPAYQNITRKQLKIGIPYLTIDYNNGYLLKLSN